MAYGRRLTRDAALSALPPALHAPRLPGPVPVRDLRAPCRTSELLGRALGRSKAAPPPLTTYGVTLTGGDQQFSIEKARRELGFTPEFDVTRGVAEGVRWYLETKRDSQGAATQEIVRAQK